eukprot:43893_1
MSDLPTAINLARRLSRQIDPDLLQENMMDESNHDRKWCETIANKVNRAAELPVECRSFSNLLANIQRRDDTKAQMAKAFEGMSAGEMEAAMSARKQGHLNPAQIQRRMTHRSKKDNRIW